MSKMDEYNLPPEVEPLSHQCAGHTVREKGMLQHRDGSIIKPVQIPPKGIRELEFYQELFAEDCSDPVLLRLKPLVPEYYGTWTNVHHPEYQYFRLEDITKPFTRPCILDVKVGEITWDPDASAKKIKTEMEKYPHLPVVKFQLLGMRVQNQSREEEFYDRFYNRKLSPTEFMTKGFDRFFQKDHGWQPAGLINAFLHRLQGIKTFFESQQNYHIFSSSVLFVYEGDTSFHPDKSHQCDVCNPTNSSSNEYISSLTEKPHNGTADNGTTKLKETDAREDATNVSKHIIKDKIEQSTNVSADSSVREADESKSSTCPWLKLLDLRMIDFTHVFKISPPTPDNNYLEGLNSLFNYLNQCKTT